MPRQKRTTVNRNVQAKDRNFLILTPFGGTTIRVTRKPIHGSPKTRAKHHYALEHD